MFQISTYYKLIKDITNIGKAKQKYLSVNEKWLIPQRGNPWAKTHLRTHKLIKENNKKDKK